MIVVLHGPMASGKTFHSEAFAKHFGCSAVADWDCRERELPRSNALLLLTNEHPDRVVAKIRKGRPDAEIRVVHIRTARLAIGVAPVAPPLRARRPAR
ncbi:hypothetical protein BV98_000555 [Sphingobium herbicidovorans NBRC 16415]|uniref:ATP-binding protein n=1 Tax=Sphingobium herbicidovorans (strain ATCC 700291 / DSM 11019 / CCUG 56400 / KCTC 2939 / LMG 18315 / NBRC 16415 / MH) TaxID=1219045 RepID=A0A086PE79_SPHHM|nr:hypothetical protein [Sphingobium herbicidovorans]KFG91697.1 hypothetical protein BV98_000555 [Sphingobium herbicidovorans NBRC 16415]